MTTILEPIGAGLAVALINKFIINNSWLWQQCTSAGDAETRDDEDCTSSSSTTTIDTVEVHAHF